MTARTGAVDAARPDNGRTFAIVAFFLFALGLGLRLLQIGEVEFWLDEALTGYLVHTEDWLYRVHNTPPLYFLLLRGWSALFGLDEASLRSLSAVSGAALIPLSMYAGRAIFGRDAGIAAGVVVLVSPISIYYAQEARPYALLTVELMLAYWMIWRVETHDRAATWVLLLLGTTAAIYTHSLSVIPLSAAYLIAVVKAYQRRQYSHVRLFLATGAASCFLYLPWFLWWINVTDFNPIDMEWLDYVWSSLPIWRFPVDSLFSFYHAASVEGQSLTGKQFHGTPALNGLPILSALALLTMLGLMLHAAVRKHRRRTDVVSLAILLFFPLFALLAVSFSKPVYLQGRYDLIAYPAFVLLSGFLLARLRDLVGTRAPVAAYALILTLLLPPMVRTVQFYMSDGGAGNSDAVAQFVADNATEGDLVLLEKGTGILTVYYLQLRGYHWTDRQCRNASEHREFDCRFLPLSLETAPAAITRHGRAERDGTLSTDAAAIVRDKRYDRIYLVAARLESNGNRLNMERSTGPVIEALADLGYAIVDVKPELDLLRLDAG